MTQAAKRGGCILTPFDVREAISVADAAKIAGRTPVTVRNWAAVHDLGRPVGGRLAISKPALAMFLDGDRAALRAYLSGDRESTLIRSYFERCGVPL